jgi:hypothetical protein
MGAYIGANERFGSGDPNHRRFEHVISYSAALESAYREIAELKDKLAQEKLYLEDEIRGEMDFEGIVGQKFGSPPRFESRGNRGSQRFDSIASGSNWYWQGINCARDP